MDRIDYLDLESELGHPFDVIWFFMRLLYGPLFWPIIVANTIRWAWCVYAGLSGLRAQ